MKRFLRDNGLSLVLAGLFLLFWGAQSVSGWLASSHEKEERGRPPENYVEYLRGGHFWRATMENWESEFLQMGLYVWLTCFLYQRGSAESKNPDKPEEVDEPAERRRNDPDAPGPVKKGGWRLALYRRSLSLAFLALFAFSFAGHAAGGWKDFNEERRERGREEVSFAAYLRQPEFWFQSFQNWQSEFLAVLAIVLLSVRLRQEGSPESKPVWKPHSATGS